MLHSRWTRTLAALTLLSAPLLFAGRALAIQDSEDKVWFGPVGIAPSERVLLSVYAIGNPNEKGVRDDTPWRFAVRVFDPRGALVEERPFQLLPGVIGSVEILAWTGTVPPLGRRTFRAEIVGFNPQPDPPGKWAVTLEVVDGVSGRTNLLLGGPDTLPAARRVTP
jgi:hypothetical protein